MEEKIKYLNLQEEDGEITGISEIDSEWQRANVEVANFISSSKGKTLFERLCSSVLKIEEFNNGTTN